MPVKRILRGFSALRRSGIFSPPRQQPRAYLDTDVKVEGHKLTFTARSVQLGTNGMSLQHADQLSLAEPVLVTFVLPSGRRVKLGAVVRWKNKGMVGLRFDPRQRNDQIHEWIHNSPVTAS